VAAVDRSISVRPRYRLLFLFKRLNRRLLNTFAEEVHQSMLFFALDFFPALLCFLFSCFLFCFLSMLYYCFEVLFCCCVSESRTKVWNLPDGMVMK